RMRQIGARLVDRGDAVMLRGAAAAEAAKLREDEPDPVAALGAIAQFGEHGVVHAVLGIDKAPQIERICAIHSCHNIPSAAFKLASVHIDSLPKEGARFCILLTTALR